MTYKLPLPNRSAPAIVFEDYIVAARELKCEVAVVMAVAKVEAPGGGFLSSGRPKILFEGHYFHKLTGGKFSAAHPTISYKTWTTRHYVGGEGEYVRLEEALQLDPIAALKSASWGRFQIMGANHGIVGYPGVELMVADCYMSEANHLKQFVKFCISTGLKDEMQRKDFAGFAKGYNGPSYVRNAYHIKMRGAYDSLKRWAYIP